MQPRTVVTLKNFSLLISLAVSVYALVRESGGSFDVGMIGFVVWVVSPYVLFFLATLLLARYTPVRQLPAIGFVIAVLMLAFTVYAYIVSLNGQSSTEALIFVFAPLWLFISAFPLLGISTLVFWLFNKRSAP